MNEPSKDQMDYVDLLRKELHLATPLLDKLCINHWRVPVAELERNQVSQLIDLLKSWNKVLPREYMVLTGQKVIPGF